jgi:hypothetical protein
VALQARGKSNRRANATLAMLSFPLLSIIGYLRIFEEDKFAYAFASCAAPGYQIKNEDVDLIRVGRNLPLN